MKVQQLSWRTAGSWQPRVGDLDGLAPQLVLVFGGRHLLERGQGLDDLRQRFPSAHHVIGSTSGEIVDTEVSEDTIAATAIAFEKTRVQSAGTRVSGSGESYDAGRRLAADLTAADTELVHVFVVSDGALVNGTELARGFNEHLPAGVLLTGGLAGDGTRFERTVVGLNQRPEPGWIAAVGFYGRSLGVRFGSAGGWEAFGPSRVVTRSEGNTLFELDGQSALALYRTYLGDQAAQLPASALRFPLAVTPGAEQTVVRTILSIDDAAQSMTFAGDIPMHARVRFMRASYEDLIDGAAAAADQARSDREADLVVCVSCVGRRIVLGQRTEEETESVRAAVGARPILTGFYSYGELAPATNSAATQLHNQTMTITSLFEA